MWWALLDRRSRKCSDDDADPSATGWPEYKRSIESRSWCKRKRPRIDGARSVGLHCWPPKPDKCSLPWPTFSKPWSPAIYAMNQASSATSIRYNLPPPPITWLNRLAQRQDVTVARRSELLSLQRTLGRPATFTIFQYRTGVY